MNSLTAVLILTVSVTYFLSQPVQAVNHYYVSVRNNFAVTAPTLCSQQATNRCARRNVYLLKR